ncbi:MAG: hypothetical protein ABJC66_16360 [Gammaproteobacteria bacterium]
MTRDVYAGDQDLDTAPAAQTASFTRITIRADADPDVLLRIAAVLNTLNSAPHEFHLQRESPDIARVEVLLKDCAEVTGNLLCRKLEQLTCVVTAERRHPVDA